MVRLRSSRIVAPAPVSASAASIPPPSPENSAAASVSALSRISEASIKFNSTATPATTLLYPALDDVEYPSLPLTTPQRTGSRIPTFAATTGKKNEDPDTNFEFRFRSAPDEGGGGKGDAKAKDAAPAVAERPILKKKQRRFSDAHRQQFAKMDSIIDHYAAKRTPPARVGLTAENNLPRGIKRSKSRAELGNREMPSSPSPVKVAVSGPRNVDDDGGSPMKRARFSAAQGDGEMTLQKKPSKIARLAGGNSGATPVKGRRHMRTVPATIAKISMDGRLKLTPSTRLASTIQAGSTPSKIPSGISTPNAVDTDSTASATPVPEAVPVPKLSARLAGTPKREQSLALAPPNTIGDFTFRSKDNTRGVFKRLSDFHSHNYNLPKPEAESESPAPAPALRIPVLSGEEDPFVSISHRVGRQRTPAAAGKRKAPHDEEKVEEVVGGGAGGGGVKKQLRFAGSEEPKAEAEVVANEECGTKKKLRFPEPEEPKPMAEKASKDKGGVKRKLDFSVPVVPVVPEEKKPAEVAKAVVGKQLKFLSPAEPKPKAEEAVTREQGGKEEEILNFSKPDEPKLQAAQVAQGNGVGRKKLPFSNPAGQNKPKPEGSAKGGTRKRLQSSEPDESGTNSEAPAAQEGSPRKRTKLSEPEESTKPKPKAVQATPAKKKSSLLKKGKAVLLRSRLNLLAAPKRRADKDQEGEGGKDKGLGRIRWN